MVYTIWIESSKGQREIGFRGQGSSCPAEGMKSCGKGSIVN